MIKIWGSKTPRSLRPIWMAEELEIEYELLPISPRSGETLTKEYTNLNPNKKFLSWNMKTLNFLKV